ncbi:MAG TPA: hypothetical protein VF618_27420 [Thermoanaerobaculia bacterium]
MLHPDGAFAGEIRLPDGASRYFVRSTYDINTAGAALVARDKGLTKFFLRRKGFPIIDGMTFFSDRLCEEIGSSRNSRAARQYAESLGYPVMVKVNSGSGGEGVERAVNETDLCETLARFFALDNIVLVESYLGGLRDYRVLVLDGEVLVAYERRPLTLVGDGTSTVGELVAAFRSTAAARGTGVPLPDRVERSLERIGVNDADILPRGELLTPMEVANLAQGGSAVEVTQGLHPRIARLAVDAAQELSLRYAGVDILSDDATGDPSLAYILELNGSPTIHQFAMLCAPEEHLLLRVHEKLIDAMARMA